MQEGMRRKGLREQVTLLRQDGGAMLPPAESFKDKIRQCEIPKNGLLSHEKIPISAHFRSLAIYNKR